MQKLKSGDFTDITETVLKTLTQNRITTVIAFLQEDVTKLSAISKLTLTQILNIRKEIFTKYSPPLINGTSLLVNNLATLISTGIESLDIATGGGIPIRTITELCGLADSGKTQLCTQIAVNSVKSTEATVLYIDTKGDFSATRILNILEGHKYSQKDMAIIMHKIHVVYIWTMEDLLELLKNLNNKTLVIENLSLLILDSLPSLMFQYLGEDNKIGLSHLNIFVNYTKQLCRSLDIAMLCVNIQTRWVDSDIADLEDEESSAFKDSYIEKRSRCLGKYWQQIPTLVLVIERAQENNSLINESQLKVYIAKYNKAAYVNRQCVLNLKIFGVT